MTPLAIAEEVMASAEKRMRALLYGEDPEELKESHRIQEMHIAASDQVQTAAARSKLKPNWGWWKRLRGR